MVDVHPLFDRSAGKKDRNPVSKFISPEIPYAPIPFVIYSGPKPTGRSRVGHTKRSKNRKIGNKHDAPRVYDKEIIVDEKDFVDVPIVEDIQYPDEDPDEDTIFDEPEFEDVDAIDDENDEGPLGWIP